jgi:hypothetical protein
MSPDHGSVGVEVVDGIGAALLLRPMKLDSLNYKRN